MWPYNPWDEGLAPNNATDDVVMAQAQVAINGDGAWSRCTPSRAPLRHLATLVHDDAHSLLTAAGFNGDTMNFIPASFWTSALALNHPLALQTEGTPSLAGLPYTKMAWGYWSYPVIPGVDSYKWLETRHITQVSDRWAQDHTNDIQGAFFNGDGFVSWENVWGIWNSISDRDAAAIKATAHLMRYFAPFFSSPDWEPHTVLHAAASAASVFASRWPLAAAPAHGYTSNATLWSIVGRSTAANFTGPTVVVPCAASGIQYFDVFRGAAVAPATVPGGGCALTLTIEAGGYGAVLAAAPNDVTPALQAFLQAQAALTARALASYSTANPILQQNMTAIQPTQPYASAPPGMVLVTGTPANQSFTFVVNGTMYEPFDDWNGPQNEGERPRMQGRADAAGAGGLQCSHTAAHSLVCHACSCARCAGVDVQFPWEPVAVRQHSPHSMTIPPFFMDKVPVSNDAFQAFQTATAYAPSDGHNFLRAWNCSGGVGSGIGCSVPPGWGAKPVTWVDLLDARAYCAWAGKRLPNDWEWQVRNAACRKAHLPSLRSTPDSSLSAATRCAVCCIAGRPLVPVGQHVRRVMRAACGQRPHHARASGQRQLPVRGVAVRRARLDGKRVAVSACRLQRLSGHLRCVLGHRCVSAATWDVVQVDQRVHGRAYASRLGARRFALRAADDGAAPLSEGQQLVGLEAPAFAATHD